MKVFVIIGDHPIYQSFDYPPKDIQIITWRWMSKNLRYGSKNFQGSIKTYGSKFFNIFHLPRFYYTFKKCDLIHSSGSLILNHKPWVVDVERAEAFTGLNEKTSQNQICKKIIERYLSSKYCKKILPHCIASKKSINRLYNIKSINDKIEVVYPAIQVKKEFSRRQNNKIRLLFVANRFYEKGGKEMLQAFSELDKKYDIELYMRSPIPKEIKERYSNNKNIFFFENILDRYKLFDLYSNSDIFILPTYDDSFGYVFLEAMSFGLPLIGNNIFAVPEIIDDGINGFLIETPVSLFNENGCVQKLPNLSKVENPIVIKQLIEKISILIDDSSLRIKMGKNSFNLVQNGRFSINERNKKLREIYISGLE